MPTVDDSGNTLYLSQVALIGLLTICSILPSSQSDRAQSRHWSCSIFSTIQHWSSAFIVPSEQTCYFFTFRRLWGLSVKTVHSHPTRPALSKRCPRCGWPWANLLLDAWQSSQLRARRATDLVPTTGKSTCYIHFPCYLCGLPIVAFKALYMSFKARTYIPPNHFIGWAIRLSPIGLISANLPVVIWQRRPHQQSTLQCFFRLSLYCKWLLS